MCFSATASFSVAAVTAVIGIAAIRHIKFPREVPVAIVPLLFAAQQSVEGIIWLQLSNSSTGNHVPELSVLYLIFAEVLWPAYAPFAVLMIETNPTRRQILSALSVIGVLLSIYLLSWLVTVTPIATIQNHSIVYGYYVNPLSWQQLVYLLCVCGPLLISSHGMIRLFGIVVLIGFAVSVYTYLTAFISVWCFFAAADSTLLYFHFKRATLAVRHSHA